MRRQLKIVWNLAGFAGTAGHGKEVCYREQKPSKCAICSHVIITYSASFQFQITDLIQHNNLSATITQMNDK
jgi:hypothetical protein